MRHAKTLKVSETFRVCKEETSALTGRIEAVEKDETRQRRIQEAIGLLERNEKLGMK